MEKSTLFGAILQTVQKMKNLMMKSCSPVMIVGITPSENLTRVVQDVGPNSLMRMRMRTITRNPHLAEAALQAVVLEVLHPVVQVAVQVDPPEAHPVVRVAVLPVEVPAVDPLVEVPAVALPVEVPAAVLPVEVPAAVLPVEAPRVDPRSVRVHHVD
tara:strand:+ start:197 stop:667 length:471 start_codon:yes stop_codon:yes gene_type:complete